MAKRSESFAKLRHEELHSYMSDLWLTEILKYLPTKPCKILDVGTGSGFFAQLLAKHHHEVDGIDLTHSMIEQAKLSLKQLSDYNSKINFQSWTRKILLMLIIVSMSSYLGI